MDTNTIVGPVTDAVTVDLLDPTGLPHVEHPIARQSPGATSNPGRRPSPPSPNTSRRDAVPAKHQVTCRMAADDSRVHGTGLRTASWWDCNDVHVAR
ncbi:hypothetical protein GCM10022248_60080 [Nonomuraea soli]